MSGPMVPLVNFNDLTGWKIIGNAPNAWSVANGVLECANQRALCMLATERSDFKDFYLRLETMLAEGRAGGISYRLTTRGAEEASYRVLIPSVNQMDRSSAVGELQFTPNFGTGGNAVTVLQKSNSAVNVNPNEWFTVEIVAAANEFMVFVNDNQVVDFRDDGERLLSGGVGILCRANTKVRVRNVEIKEIRGSVSGSSDRK